MDEEMRMDIHQNYKDVCLQLQTFPRSFCEKELIILQRSEDEVYNYLKRKYQDEDDFYGIVYLGKIYIDDSTYFYYVGCTTKELIVRAEQERSRGIRDGSGIQRCMYRAIRCEYFEITKCSSKMNLLLAETECIFMVFSQTNYLLNRNLSKQKREEIFDKEDC